MTNLETLVNKAENARINGDYIIAVRAAAMLKTSLKGDDFVSKEAYTAYKDTLLSIQARVEKAVSMALLDNNTSTEIETEYRREIESLYGGLCNAIRLKHEKTREFTDARLVFSEQLVKLFESAVFTWRFDAEKQCRIPVSVSAETFRKNFESIIVNIIDGVTVIDIDMIEAEKARKKEEKKKAKAAAKKAAASK